MRLLTTQEVLDLTNFNLTVIVANQNMDDNLGHDATMWRGVLAQSMLSKRTSAIIAYRDEDAVY